MYAETYKKLKEKYNFDNFEIAAEVIEKYFGDLFRLSVVESELEKGRTDSSYMRLFDRCMRELKDLYTAGEVVEKLYDVLNHPDMKALMLHQFVFVPEAGSQRSAQAGFLEKLAVGDLKEVGESLTFLDMKRLVKGLEHLKSGRYFFGPSAARVSVAHAYHLAAMSPATIAQLKRDNQALLVNFNLNPKGTPKWGVVDLAGNRIFCETPLTEPEKRALKDHLRLDDPEFVGGRADGLASTGYTALAWLDKEITHAWNFDVDADFTATLKDFLFTLFGGDSTSITYCLTAGEAARFSTEAFRHLLHMAGYHDDETLLTGGTIFTRSGHISTLGKLRGKEYTPGDLTAVLQAYQENRLRLYDIDRDYYSSMRTLVVGFDNTLTQLGHIVQDKDSSTLTVPPVIDFDRLDRDHESYCRPTNTNPAHLRARSSTDEYNPTGIRTREENVAVMMVFAFIRAKSKKRLLTIDLPERFQLTEEEQQFVTRTLLQNPFVTELEVGANRSLQAVKEALIPTLARNRWLAACGYRPPLIDNFWKQAAKHWLIHLHEQPTILEAKTEHESFKRCVLEMGVQGLDHALKFLADPLQRDFLDSIYGADKRVFYAACPATDYPAYLGMLLDHLRARAYFPFNELGIAYQPGNDRPLIELLGEINRLEQFEQVTLTECLKDKRACRDFLTQLIEIADREKWVGLVVIPELQDQDNVDEDTRQLRVLYTLLNDVILRNRHQHASDQLLERINGIVADYGRLGPRAEAMPHETPSEVADAGDLHDVIHGAIGRLPHDFQLPIRKSGAVQLQMQMQQQIEQVRQVQQEKQRVVLTTIEQPIAGDLIDHHNIDRLLGGFWEEYSRENPIEARAATLRSGGESLLQGFFHTWINANPAVEASEVIRKMTPDAAKALLRKHTRLPSGLNPENLPKGFYTQRSEDGYLILCYSPELAYINPPNALTIDLDVRPPMAEAWEGDFRQFNLEKYRAGGGRLDGEDWLNIALFAQLQPPRDYMADFEAFYRKNSALFPSTGGFFGRSGLSSSHRDKIIRHWLVFLQVWQYAGPEGIGEFLAKDERDFHLAIPHAFDILLQRQPGELREWASERFRENEHFLRALGQIYYQYGDAGVNNFLSMLRHAETNLGSEFLRVFARSVLSASPNFNCFISERFFTAMGDMMEKLKPVSARGQLHAWQTILELHMTAVGWETVEKLWRGFEHFTAELTDMGIELHGDEFDGLRPENMLVSMDRILASLKQIPSQDDKIRFIQQLHELDLTHGGVHYALQHEGFKHFDRELELYDFEKGTPTYASDLTDLYRWMGTTAALNMKRALASKPQFGHHDFRVLTERLGNDRVTSKDSLMWLLHTQYPIGDIAGVLDAVEELPSEFQARIARHLHHAVYRLGNSNLAIRLESMQALAAQGFDPELLVRHPNGTFLEAATILHQARRWQSPDVERMMALFAEDIHKEAAYPDYLYTQGYKLATLFGVYRSVQLQQFYQATADLKPVVRQELNLLITQLLSIDYTTTGEHLPELVQPENWEALLVCVQEMQGDLAHTAEHRIAFIERLNAQGIQFKYSKSGAFRTLNSRAEEGPGDLGFFVDHDARLWEFMQNHLVVPSAYDAAGAKEALLPTIRFLKRLQLNRTYLNEIEPLLASLETTKGGGYWSVDYFYGLLRALQPENDQTSFPISLLKVMLQEPAIAAKPIDSVEKEFPTVLIPHIKTILQNTEFDRNQQATLCQIALREYAWNGSVAKLPQIMATLSSPLYKDSRGYALEILAKSTHFSELESRFEKCCRLLQHPYATEEGFVGQWTDISALWLKALSTRKNEEDLYDRIASDFVDDEERQALILKIIAYSSLRPGLRDTDTYQYQLNKKAPKLAQRLGDMSLEDLKLLAQCYPQEPAPSAEDILHLIKKHERDGLEWAACLDGFLRTPYPEPRADYGFVASLRDYDLQRMIAETKVSGADARQGLSAKDAARLTLIFSYLKQFESGAQRIEGVGKPIGKMSQEELATAYRRLSEASKREPDNDALRAQVWAVLFEVLGRTTRKYPHLAQQFALIANDVCVNADTRVLQLATGEGKSHFVAMRAARNAGLGKMVDVCTAKRTLAERDLKDYQSFFDYLGLTTSYIHPKSLRETYMRSQIHYTTTGDLSLFLDEQSYRGMPIVIPRDQRVGLFDEFDFIRFEEGRKTEYNYAQPTGKTPKQMTWFYQAVNAFYKANQEELVEGIDIDILQQFADFLLREAHENEERQNLVRQMARDPLQLAQWLQSAHEAHELVWGIGFTVRDVTIEIGDESYPMREIIPLSADNQPMVGSTFSAGVHQLLAVRLNTEAKALPADTDPRKKAQNFHIHAESHIVSSQVAAERMRQLWGSWEGFSGTISAAQATTLYRERRTQVLHVPTNQRDLRFWHKPEFFTSDLPREAETRAQAEEKRMEAVVKQIRLCLKNKQSMLFSCRNDAHVKELEALLRARLTPDELEQFLFYTNEDERTPAQVLEEKQTQEAWRGGKKQRAMALVASGFGRGDNVGVEAVFLFDVNDNNDKLQKGGRTARNGEEGEVFQFYLARDLEAEEAHLWDIIDAVAPDVLEEIRGKFIAGGLLEHEADAEITLSPEEQQFERVMHLREYIFSLQNAPNQGYRSAIAQLSSWAMTLLGQVDDADVRQELTTFFSFHLKELEKIWIEISGSAQSIDDKIITIKRIIKERTIPEFVERYREKTERDVEPYRFEPHTPVQIDLVVSPPPAKPTEKDKLIAAICSVMTRLQGWDLTDAKTAEIPEKIQSLAEHGDERHLRKFAQDVAACRSAKEFINILRINHRQMQHPSPAWVEALEASELSIEADEFLEGVEERLKLEFAGLLGKLLPELQEGIINTLSKSSLEERDTRIQQALPILRYLACFSEEEQDNWGMEYIEYLANIQREIPEEVLKAYLGESRPMSYRDFIALWGLAKSVDYEGCPLPAVLSQLEHSLKGDSEHRLRTLLDWQLLSSGMKEQDAAAFLMDFSRAMQQFTEGKDWDIFASLVKKTKAWWNVTEGEHQPALKTLWQHLSAYGDHLPDINDFMRWSMGLGGKSWYQILNVGLQSSLTASQLNEHAEQFRQFWQHLDLFDIKKTEKTAQFGKCCQGIANAYQLITKTEADQERLRAQLLSLDGARIRLLTQFINKNLENLQEFPQVFATLLDHFADEAISVERLQPFAEILETAMEYQGDYPDTLNDLLANFARVRPALFGLDDERFERIMRLTQENLEWFLQYPQAHAALLRDITNPDLPLPRFDRLSSLIVNHALPLQEAHPDTIQALLTRLERAMPQLITLDDETFNLVMDSSERRMASFLDYPTVHDALLNYAFDEDRALESMRTLEFILNHAVKLKRAHAEISMEHLLAGVERFRNKDESVLKEELRLLQASDGSPHPLFDNAAETLTHAIPIASKDQVREVVVSFYQAAKDTEGQAGAMLNHPDVRELFTFSPYESDTIRDKRIIWMHLLHNQVFVTEGVGPADGHPYVWNRAHNNALTQAGFEQYTRHMRTVMEEGRVATDVNHTRDLTVTQQRRLLQLTSEFEIIGTRLPEARRAPDTQWGDLSAKLHHLVGQYQATWFKSIDRRVIASQLTEQVDRIMEDSEGSGLPVSRYQLVLAAIHQAKMQIVEYDTERNKSRWSWFKFNRSGQSRLYNTINQMQDEVLRCWSQDIGDVRALQSYEAFNRQEFIDLTKCLQKSVKAHWEETRYVSYDDRYNGFSRRIGNFFTRQETKNAFDRLMQAVDAFVADHPSDGGFPPHVSEISADEVEKLLEELHRDLPRMPGHIATLVKEVLARGDSLATHLRQQGSYDEVRSTAILRGPAVGFGAEE
ncbi:hypothetical protein [Legionella nagasakiensis]|uniref:hypothetical protein n=1 Tax=Legionella nagasakiensis TaxID=535290 RepID=UPI00105637D2|nr:hypothetical protein [Legionella nagasakiensis]